MPELMCTAVTCRHNAGNLGGTASRQGEFPCTAPAVRFACVDILSECRECGGKQELEQRQDCLTYSHWERGVRADAGQS